MSDVTLARIHAATPDFKYFVKAKTTKDEPEDSYYLVSKKFVFNPETQNNIRYIVGRRWESVLQNQQNPIPLYIQKNLSLKVSEFSEILRRYSLEKKALSIRSVKVLETKNPLYSSLTLIAEHKEKLSLHNCHCLTPGSMGLFQYTLFVASNRPSPISTSMQFDSIKKLTLSAHENDLNFSKMKPMLSLTDIDVINIQMTQIRFFEILNIFPNLVTIIIKKTDIDDLFWANIIDFFPAFKHQYMRSVKNLTAVESFKFTRKHF